VLLVVQVSFNLPTLVMMEAFSIIWHKQVVEMQGKQGQQQQVSRVLLEQLLRLVQSRVLVWDMWLF
jgi:hypothetical protein